MRVPRLRKNSRFLIFTSGLFLLAVSHAEAIAALI